MCNEFGGFYHKNGKVNFSDRIFEKKNEMEIKTVYQIGMMNVLGNLWMGGIGALQINTPKIWFDTLENLKAQAQELFECCGDFDGTIGALVEFCQKETIILDSKDYHHYNYDVFTLGTLTDKQVDILFSIYEEG